MPSKQRKAGILLPISSLPSRYGIGDFGTGAYKFAEFLHSAGQSMWQILPLTAIDSGCGNSPYSPTSAFAGNYIFVSPEILAEQNLISRDALNNLAKKYDFDENIETANYENARKFKIEVMNIAFENFKKNNISDFENFCLKSREWLDVFSLFITLKNFNNGLAWYDWPDEFKFRDKTAINNFKNEHREEISRQNFYQYVFFKQQARLKKYLNSLNIELVGDIPLYVTRDCADVWEYPAFFNLDDKLNPITVAGVPPDYFSETGQLWGNPTYNWDNLERWGFAWWLKRLTHSMKLFDRVRIDHFRGLVAYWAVPYGESTAKNGEWVQVPYKKFFGCLLQNFPDMPFWAENLGIITPDVEELRKNFKLPGMLILHFAFSDPANNPYAPHNHTRDNVIYTGTHDNNTSRGWFRNDASEQELKNFSAYIGRDALDEYIFTSEIVRMAVSSVADNAIIQMQDYLRLGPEARINVPSTASGNWTWRMRPDALSEGLAGRIRDACKLYGRN